MRDSVAALRGQKRKRVKADFPFHKAIVCTECQARSGKCDAQQPCSRCQTARRTCVYDISDFAGSTPAGELSTPLSTEGVAIFSPARMLSPSTESNTICVRSSGLDSNTDTTPLHFALSPNVSTPCWSLDSSILAIDTQDARHVDDYGEESYAPYGLPIDAGGSNNTPNPPRYVNLADIAHQPDPSRPLENVHLPTADGQSSQTFSGAGQRVDNKSSRIFNQSLSPCTYDTLIAKICELKERDSTIRMQLGDKLELAGLKLHSSEQACTMWKEKFDQEYNKTKFMEEQLSDIQTELAREKEQHGAVKQDRDKFEAEVKRQKASIKQKLSGIIDSL